MNKLAFELGMHQALMEKLAIGREALLHYGLPALAGAAGLGGLAVAQRPEGTSAAKALGQGVFSGGLAGLGVGMATKGIRNMLRQGKKVVRQREAYEKARQVVNQQVESGAIASAEAARRAVRKMVAKSESAGLGAEARGASQSRLQQIMEELPETAWKPAHVIER